MASEEYPLDNSAPYHETQFHDNPYEQLGYDNLSWLATTKTNLSTIVDVARLRAANREAYAAILKATGDYTKVRILRLTVIRYGAVTYATLDDAIGDRSKRTIKSKVAELRDDGVLDVTDGRPAAIGFPNDAIALLVEDVLSFIE